MHATRPDVVILAVARVGGIYANASRPADFLDENLTLQTKVIHTAAEVGLRKLVFLGSSCIYPRLAPQSIHESALQLQRDVTEIGEGMDRADRHIGQLQSGFTQLRAVLALTS
jgi:nucleoside-diphosphate-sugar epimerase